MNSCHDIFFIMIILIIILTYLIHKKRSHIEQFKFGNMSNMTNKNKTKISSGICHTDCPKQENCTNPCLPCRKDSSKSSPQRKLLDSIYKHGLDNIIKNKLYDIDINIDKNLSKLIQKSRTIVPIFDNILFKLNDLRDDLNNPDIDFKKVAEKIHLLNEISTLMEFPLLSLPPKLVDDGTFNSR